MNIIVGIISALAGIGIGYVVRYMLGSYRAEGKEQKAQAILDKSRSEADSIRKEAEIQAKAEVLRAREEFEQTTKSKLDKLADQEERMAERESNLDRKVSMIEKKEYNLENRVAELDRDKAALERERNEVAQLATQGKAKLQEIAGMTEEEARSSLLQRVEKEVHGEMGSMIRKLQEQARETANREAKKIVALSIQKYAASHASEMTTSTVLLPNDGMKGRIIGRDGRNIKALESATGINVLIDDTPEAVVISGFDPIRREIARQSLEALISDGRIHPARIEEVVERTREHLDETVRTAGEEAAYSVGAQGISPELLRMLGRLQFRTSYSQNVLQHSVEVAQLMGGMAGELDLDVSLAKRAGIFHDIGKALDHEIEGGHAVIGADLLKKEGESPVVVNAVAAHHEEVESESLYAVLASAADAISSSRVGARSETTEIYVKRLEKLESIAMEFEGVAKSYAMQAGREVRIIVIPEKVNDDGTAVLARDISRKIEKDLRYPGQIKVVVVRETRCVEYAH
jgi:ribonuclease Y